MTIKLDDNAVWDAAKTFDRHMENGSGPETPLRMAIATYLENMPDEDEPAPEGVEFDMSIYITSDKSGASTRLAFPGNVKRPPPSVPVNVRELIESLAPKSKLQLWAIASDWRVMTRAEITAYKMRSVGVEARPLDS